MTWISLNTPARLALTAAAAIVVATGLRLQAVDDRQSEQATQPGRGRQADSFFAIPAAGWKDIFLRTYREFSRDRLSYVSGGVAFFILVALVPGLTTFISLYGLFADPATVHQHLALLEGLIPPEASTLVRGEIERISGQGGVTLGITSALSLLIAVWSANAGTKALLDGLNVAYAETEKRSYLRLSLISFAFTLGAMVSLALGGAVFLIGPPILAALGLYASIETWVSALRWPIVFVLVAGALSIVFRYGPSREMPKWRWLTFGSSLAAGTWLAASAIYTWYLSNFADYSATYGSLGAAVGLLMWLWITATVVLAGAKLDAEIEHQTVRDTTTGDDKPMGSRGATVADTLGQAQH